MVERRVDHAKRKRVAEMSPEEMRHALLVSDKTGLPNRRAFDEGCPRSMDRHVRLQRSQGDERQLRIQSRGHTDSTTR